MIDTPTPELRRLSVIVPAYNEKTTLLEIVRRMRASFVSWVSIGGGLVVLDLAAGGGFGWLSFGVAVWGGFSLLPQLMKLWNAGYSWRDILNRPVAPDGVEARLSKSGKRGQLGPATADEFGRHMDAVTQARLDRQAILKIMDRLPASERKLLPDVIDTVDKLLHRASDCWLHLPATIGNFTDFFAGIHHATNGGRRRDPESLREGHRSSRGVLIPRSCSRRLRC